MPEFSIETQTQGHYLLTHAEDDNGLLVVGFHGYAESAAQQMQRLEAAMLNKAMLCSVQGLHCFYRGREVVASWMTSQHREQCIANNINYIDRVLDNIQQTHPWQQLILVGYSQGAGMAYRAAAAGRHQCHGLFINGGDIPPDVLPLSATLPPLCIVRGHDDSAYDKDKLSADCKHLNGIAYQVHEFPGDHEWTDVCNDQLALFIASLKQ